MSYSLDYRRRFGAAVKLRDKGDAAGAIGILRQLIAEFPDKSAAYLVTADILWDQGSLAKASNEFRATTERFPDLKIASLGLFHTLWAQSKTDAAFDEMKRFQKISFCREYEDIVNEILKKD